MRSRARSMLAGSRLSKKAKPCRVNAGMNSEAPCTPTASLSQSSGEPAINAFTFA